MQLPAMRCCGMCAAVRALPRLTCMLARVRTERVVPGAWGPAQWRHL